MVDDPRDALECFGSAPIDLLAIGPFVVRRPAAPGPAGPASPRRRWPGDSGPPPGRRRRADDRAPLAARPAGRARRPGRAAARARRRSWTTAAGTTGDGLGGVVPGALRPRTLVLRSGGRGPAAARNAGWRAARAPWIAFLDDDVLVPAGLDAPARRRPRARSAPPSRGSQGRDPRAAPGRPAPDGLGAQRRRPGDRDVGDRRPGLPARRARPPPAASTSASPAPTARTPTSGCASPAAAWRIVRGRRRSSTPSPRRGRWVSLRKQAGNRDDPLMRRLHGARLARARAVRRAGASRATPRSTRGRAVAARRRRHRPHAADARPAGCGWPAPPSWPGARIAAGPRDRGEVATMLATSAALPAVAAAERLRGELSRAAAGPPARGPRDRAARRRAPRPRRHAGRRRPLQRRPRARGADAGRARGARPPARRGRAARRRVQPERRRARAAHHGRTSTRSTRRVEELLGPLGAWAVCPHGPDDGCACRKPAPGLVLQRGRGAGRRAAALRRRRRHRRRRARPPRAAGARGDPRPDAGDAPRRRSRGRRPEVAAADLGAAVDAACCGGGAGMRPHVLVARQDNDGDVLLAGPAVRAVAAGAREVTLLCGPRGAQAAGLLPGVDRVLVHEAAWIDARAAPGRRDTRSTPSSIASRAARRRRASILTSFHQSPLPLALLLRMAGVPRAGAISVDYPGSLLDVRHAVADDVHEVVRALSLAAAMGFALPPGDDGALAVSRRARRAGALRRRALRGRASRRVRARARLGAPSATARSSPRSPPAGATSPSPASPAEVALTAAVAGRRAPGVADLGGAHHARRLAGVLARADAVVVGNTGPAHLAAAVGTPVVSLFAPTVPAARWRPWAVAHELLHRRRPVRGLPRARVSGGGPSVPRGRERRRGRRGARPPGRDRRARRSWRREGPALARPRLVDDVVRPGRATSTWCRCCPTAGPTAAGGRRRGTGPRRRPR